MNGVKKRAVASTNVCGDLWQDVPTKYSELYVLDVKTGDTGNLSNIFHVTFFLV